MPKQTRKISALFNELNIDTSRVGDAYATIEGGTSLTNVNGLTEIDEDTERQIKALLIGKTSKRQPMLSGNRSSEPANSLKIQSAEVTDDFYLGAIADQMRLFERKERARTDVIGWVDALLSGQGYPEGISPKVEKGIHLLAAKIIRYNAVSFSVGGYPRAQIILDNEFLALLDEPLAPETEDLVRYQELTQSRFGDSAPRLRSAAA